MYYIDTYHYAVKHKLQINVAHVFIFNTINIFIISKVKL
jgi:hypothetical protein